jgi:hypothetical protein
MVSANRPCGRAFRAAVAALVLVAIGNLPAQADVGSDRRPKSLIAIGPSFELDTDASMRFGGEVTLTQYSGRSGFGIAAGFVPGRIYLELQPVWVLGGQPQRARGQPQPSNHFVLGLNPGAVVDVTKNLPCYGGQVTLWGTYARGGPSPWAFPLFPFVRVQAVAWLGFVVTGGVMLKLPIPIS